MRKKIFLIFFICVIGMLIFNSNVYALDVSCPALGNVVIDQKIADIVKLIVKVIQIAVPVLLVVFGSFDLVKGLIAQKEDEIKKGQQTLIKRLIAGVIVFFVIALVKLLISAVAGNGDIWNCACQFIGDDCASSEPVEHNNGAINDGQNE